SYGRVLVLAGEGDNTIQLVNPTIPVTVLAGGGNDKVQIDGRTSANTFDVDDTSVTANGETVDLFNVDRLLINGKRAGDTFRLDTLPSYARALQGAGGLDTLVGPDVASTWQITGSSAGTLDGVVAFSAIENLTGGSADDAFVFGAARALGGQVNGGGGI